MGQKRILLRLVQPMNLVGEKDCSAPYREPLLRFGDDLAHARNAFGDGGERNELAFGIGGDEPSERRFSAARRSPENDGTDSATLDGVPERLPGRERSEERRVGKEWRWTWAA